MKPIAIVVAVGVVAGAFALASTSSGTKAPTATRGFQRNGWFQLVVRSSMSVHTFGVDAVRQQLQAMLGREAFDVRTVASLAPDPFVFRVVGVYRGESGAIVDPPGVIVLSAKMSSPENADDAPAHIDERPIALVPGKTYRARASISWPLSMLVTRAAVISKLSDLGFTEIVVSFDAKALPADWPPAERGGDLFVSATYNGEPKSMQVPSQLLSVWT